VVKSRPPLASLLSRRLPVYYGWVVLASLCCAGFARQGPAVATFSIFIAPLADQFGWSRTALSGAASLGGLLAAVAAPPIGAVLDRHGARVILCTAVLVTAAALMLLSLTSSLAVFYLLFCIARMNWAAPFELGLYGALNNWFVRKRTTASSVATLAQMAGLVAMPLVAQFAIVERGWRAGWLAIGAVTLVVGFLPTWALLVRRPEDLGLAPDGDGTAAGDDAPIARSALPEPLFSRREALATPAFWLLLLYAVLLYPVQAGVSLHQAPYLIERGIDPTIAATIVSTFSAASAAATIACGFIPRDISIRFALVAIAAVMMSGVVLMLGVHAPPRGYLAAGVFGFGIGAMLTLLPVAWADYFGRSNYGAIRGIALPAQVVAQAAGPLLSGILRDATGDYVLSLDCLAALAALGAVAALAARQPTPRLTAGIAD
jgi:MFS transporter, OFA family, oxalate/formate antiporter